MRRGHRSPTDTLSLDLLYTLAAPQSRGTAANNHKWKVQRTRPNFAPYGKQLKLYVAPGTPYARLESTSTHRVWFTATTEAYAQTSRLLIVSSKNDMLASPTISVVKLLPLGLLASNTSEQPTTAPTSLLKHWDRPRTTLTVNVYSPKSINMYKPI